MSELKIDKRRLNDSRRLMLMSFAFRKFIDEPLRERETALKEAMLKSVMIDAAAIPKTTIKVLTQYAHTSPVKTVQICHRVRIVDGVKSFQKPDGSFVERPNRREINFPSTKYQSSVYSMADLGFIFSKNETCPSDEKYNGSIRTFDLPREITVPAGGSGQVWLERKVDDEKDNAHWQWLSEATFTAQESFVQAAAARANAEFALHKAIFKVVVAAKAYLDILAIWPEVAEIEKDLFGEPVIPANLALSVLNSDDVALLCNHMGRRGITSSVCAIATSEAYAEAAA